MVNEPVNGRRRGHRNLKNGSSENSGECRCSAAEANALFSQPFLPSCRPVDGLLRLPGPVNDLSAILRYDVKRVIDDLRVRRMLLDFLLV